MKVLQIAYLKNVQKKLISLNGNKHNFLMDANDYYSLCYNTYKTNE